MLINYMAVVTLISVAFLLTYLLYTQILKKTLALYLAAGIAGMVLAAEFLALQVILPGITNNHVIYMGLFTVINAFLLYWLIIKPYMQRDNLDMGIIADNLTDGIIVFDDGGIIGYANPAAENIFGYERGGLTGQAVASIIPSKDNYNPIRHTLQSWVREEGAGKTKNGDKISIYLALNKIIAPDNRVIFAGVIQDISRRKEIEKQKDKELNAAIEASLAKSHFLAYMSHEIRTPMNTIIGVTDLLSEMSPDKEQTELLSTMNISEEHLMGIINNILDLSKIEAGKMELEAGYFELDKLMKVIYEMFYIKTTTKKIRLNYSLSPMIPCRLIGDSHKLKQVLINLVGNAIKFTQAGSVEISVREIQQHNGEVILLFEVSDTGIGIPLDKIDRIFDDYIQAAPSVASTYGGTGLGLTISKKLVELMGGHIWVESAIDRADQGGSRFSFTAKFIQAGAKPMADNNQTTSEPTHHRQERACSILLVDDSDDNRNVLQLYLQKLPCMVDTAENGLVAVSKVKQSRYDMVLMDMQMPVMDGCMATRQIRAWEYENNLPQIPILAISADAFDDMKQKSLEAGCTTYLTKPVKKATLLETVNQYLN